MQRLRRHHPGAPMGDLKPPVAFAVRAKDPSERVDPPYWLHRLHRSCCEQVRLGFAHGARANLRSSLEPDLRTLAGCPAEIQPAAPLPGHKDTLVSVRSPATSSRRNRVA